MQHSTADSGSWLRGGFWRRVFALLIDVILVSIVVSAIGIPLYGITGGAIRVGNTIVNITTCTAVTPKQPNLQLPADFKVTEAAVCVKTIFGQEHDRLVVLREVTRSGAVTYTRTMTMPVDAKGHVTKALYLDYLTVFLIAAYLLICEWRFGATLGKRILGLRVRSLDGASITVSQAAIRTLVRLIPSAPIVAIILIAAVLDPPSAAAFLLSNLTIIGILSLGLLLIFLLNFILAVRRRNLPWHDRWAGTEVVRFVPPTSAVAQAPAPPAGEGSAPSG